MPNVAPRGLWAYDPVSGARLVVLKPWVYDPSTGARLEVVRGWIYDEAGNRQLIWSAGATAPTTVVAAYSPTTTQVTLTWAAPSIREADEWEVRRPNGTVVARVPYTTLTLDDPYPLPVQGAYTVHGVLSHVVGAGASSNTLDLRLQAASFTATWNAGANRVDFAGTANALGPPDRWHYYRGLDYFAQNVWPAPAGYDGQPIRGSVTTYEVRPALLTSPPSTYTEGLGRASAPVSIPPNVPRITYWGPSGLSNLQLQFWGPAEGIATNYEYQTSTNGSTWSASGYDTSGVVNFATSVPMYARVRSIAPGGLSDWVTSAASTPVTDVTGPGPSWITSWKPEGSYGRMVVRGYTPADADTRWVHVYWRQNVNGAGFSAWNLAVDGGIAVNAPFAWHIVTSGDPGQGGSNVIEVLVRTFDALNNVGTDAVASYTVLHSPIDITADGSNYWQNGQYNVDGTKRPHQGYFSNAGLWTVGTWYYGTKIATQIGGRTVYQMNVIMIRPSTGGNNANDMVNLYTHNDQYDPGNANLPVVPLGPGMEWGTMAWGQIRELPISAEMKDMLVSGTHRGLAMYRPTGKPYVILESRYANLYSGLIRAYHLG